MLVLQHVVVRQRELDVDRVQLRDLGQQAGIARLHQAALGTRLGTGHAGDRRGDAGVAEIDLRRLHRRAGGGDRGLGAGQCGHRVVAVLLADGIFLEQRQYAVVVLLRADQLGFFQLQRRLRLLQCRLVRCGVELEQHVTGAHAGTLGVGTLLQNAGDAGAHLHLARADRLADVLGDHRHIGGGHLHHADRHRRHRPVTGSLLALLPASGQHHCQRQQRQRPFMIIERTHQRSP
ncbi:hypothetical protein D3C72_1573090 [compost metagenome]